MKALLSSSLLAVVIGCSSAPPPAAPPDPAPAAVPPPAEPAAKSDAVARADALLEDMKRREAAFAKLERDNPPPPAPRLEDFIRPSVAPTPQPERPIIADSAQPPTSPGPEAASDERTTQRYWQDRMRQLQSRLDSDALALTAARANERDLDRYLSPDGSMTRTVADNMFKSRAEVARLTAAVASSRSDVTALQEEARRAGIPPGWLRP